MSTTSSSSSLDDTEEEDTKVKARKRKWKTKSEVKDKRLKVKDTKVDAKDDRKQDTKDPKVKAADSKVVAKKAKVKVKDVKAKDVKVKDAKVKDTKVKVKEMGVSGAETRQLREQLHAKVSDSLAVRGVDTKDRWSKKPKGSLTEEEWTRLQRQRFNKRKWASKERERSRKLMETLRYANGQLEYKNQELRKDVDKLIQLQLKMRSLLIEHKCETDSPPPRASLPQGPVQILRIPGSNGTSRLVAVSGKDSGRILNGGDKFGADRFANPGPGRFCRLSSIGEDESETTAHVLPSLVRIKGTDIILQNGVLYGKGKGILRPLPMPRSAVYSKPSATITSANAEDASVRSSAESYYGSQRPVGGAAAASKGYPDHPTRPVAVKTFENINEDDLEEDGPVSSPAIPFSSPPHTPATTTATTTAAPSVTSGSSEQSNLYSGGFLYNELNSNKTFLQMLQEGDDNGNDVIMVDENADDSEFEMPEIKTEPLSSGDEDVASDILPESVQAIIAKEADLENDAKPYSRSLSAENIAAAFKKQNRTSSTFADQSHTRNVNNPSYASSNTNASTNDASKSPKKRTKQGFLMDKWRAEEDRRLKAEEDKRQRAQKNAKTSPEFRRITRSASHNAQVSSSYESPTSTGSPEASEERASAEMSRSPSGGFKMPATRTRRSRAKGAERGYSWPEGLDEAQKTSPFIPPFARSQSLPTTLPDAPLQIVEADSIESLAEEQVETEYEEVETEIVDSDFIAEALDEHSAVSIITSSGEFVPIAEYANQVATTSYEVVNSSYEVSSSSSVDPASLGVDSSSSLPPYVSVSSLSAPYAGNAAMMAEAQQSSHSARFTLGNGNEGFVRSEPAVEGLGSRQAWEILCEVSSDVLNGELQAELIQSQG